MADNNATVAISNIANTGAKVVDTIDIDLYHSIQPWLNKLYSGQFKSFFAISVFGIPLANVLAAFIALFFFLVLRKLFTSFVIMLLTKLAKRTKNRYDDMIVVELRGPIRFLFIILGLRVFFQLIFQETDLIKNLLDAATIYFIFWVFYAMTPAVKELLIKYSDSNQHLSYELTNFMVRIIRILIVFLGLISILYSFGVNVTAFFASLGIGGLALALAAKDTAANLFGSLALLIDRSVMIGEWIKVDGIEGTVEDIGMRTTKIRTFEKSIIAIPNSIVANSHIENYSRRGIRRIKMVVGLTYDTDQNQMENIITDIREMLSTHPDISQRDTLLVNFTDFNASDLGIMIYCFANTSNWSQYLDIRQDINLKVMELVNKNGCSFAFPSQSIYVESMPNG